MPILRYEAVDMMERYVLVVFWSASKMYFEAYVLISDNVACVYSSNPENLKRGRLLQIKINICINQYI